VDLQTFFFEEIAEFKSVHTNFSFMYSPVLVHMTLPKEQPKSSHAATQFISVTIKTEMK